MTLNEHTVTIKDHLHAGQPLLAARLLHGLVGTPEHAAAVADFTARVDLEALATKVGFVTHPTGRSARMGRLADTLGEPTDVLWAPDGDGGVVTRLRQADLKAAIRAHQRRLGALVDEVFTGLIAPTMVHPGFRAFRCVLFETVFEANAPAGAFASKTTRPLAGQCDEANHVRELLYPVAPDWPPHEPIAWTVFESTMCVALATTELGALEDPDRARGDVFATFEQLLGWLDVCLLEVLLGLE